MNTESERLPRVFVSSSMSDPWLVDVRASLCESLNQSFINAFVWEQTYCVNGKPILETALAEVEKCTLFVALFAQKFGDITRREFMHARSLQKPVFVYIRKGDFMPDKELDDFLKDNVLDPVTGASYAFFSEVRPLCKKVPYEIISFLFSQNSRVLPSSAIHPALRLAVDVADWFCCLGHEVAKDPAYISANAAALCIKVDFTVPGTRKVHQQLDIHCTNALIDRDYVEAHGTEFRRQGGDRLLIVSALGVMPAARELIQRLDYTTALTFDELLDQTVRFEPYLDALEQQIRQMGVDVHYVPLGCVSESSGAFSWHDGGVDRYAEFWIRSPEKEHLSVLGEFGTGKTWFLYHLAWRTLKAYREAKSAGLPRPRLPLVVPLRDFTKAVSLESLFSEFFFKQHDIGLPNYKAFQLLNQMGKLLLLFDGFDEMAVRVDKQKMADNFWEFARVLVPGGKALLTCRSEHFPTALEGRELLRADLKTATAELTGRPPQFEVVELDKFDPQQVRQILEKRTGDCQTVERILANEDLAIIVRRPLMVELILTALPDIEIGKRLDLARIYLYAMRRTLEKNIERQKTFTSLADKLYFLAELSWELLSSNQPSLNYRLIPDRVRKLFPGAVQTAKELDYFWTDLRTQTMLVRNAEGDYSLAHRSFTEFFAAYRYVATMGVLADDFTEVARCQSNIDPHTDARNYTWTAYFQREFDAFGQAKQIAPLKNFVSEEFSSLSSAGPTFGVVPDRDLTSIESMSRNALAFAAGMISKEPAHLEHLCNLAWDTTGRAAWNALNLLPFLRDSAAEMVVQMLIARSEGRHLRSGVVWVLGELGLASQPVLAALKRTLSADGEGEIKSPSGWWEAAFALEKLGALGQRKGRQGDEALDQLISHLPPGCTLQQAINNLRQAFLAAGGKKASINQRDIVVIVEHESETDKEWLFNHVLKLADYVSDTTGRRSYYAVWLCGHLQIKISLASVLGATKHRLSSVRNAAAEALGKLGVHIPEVIAALEGLLRDDYYRTRYHAGWALAELGAIESIPQISAAIRVEEVTYVEKALAAFSATLGK